MNRFAVLLLLPMFWGCDFSNNNVGTLSFEVISMPGIDRLSLGGSFQVVVHTQREYEALIFERFQKRLNDYCNRNYSELRQTLMASGFSEAEIQRRVNATCISRTPVFRGLEEVTHPKIDFSTHTLLGQSASASGCSKPDYKIDLIKEPDNEHYVLHIQITEYGSCEPIYFKNIWVLSSKIPASSTVEFQFEIIQE